MGIDLSKIDRRSRPLLGTKGFLGAGRPFLTGNGLYLAERPRPLLGIREFLGEG